MRALGRVHYSERLPWLALVLSAAAALRFFKLGSNSLWVDEFASLGTSRHSLAEIPAAALRGDAFEPPLYFWLLHLVVGLLGDSEAALRFCSALAGAITVVVMWRLVRELGGSIEAASLCAVLLAVNPLHLWYSQEARPYALLLCLGLTSLVFLLMALRTEGWIHWAGYAMFASLAVLTHATGIVFPAVGCLWAVAAGRGQAMLQRFTAASFAVLLTTSPFLVELAHSIRGSEGTGSPPRAMTGLEIPYTLITYVAGYSFGPPVREIQDLGWVAAVSNHPVQTGIMAVSLAVLGVIACRPRSHAGAFLAALAAAPVLATFVLALVTTKAYNVRYTLPSLVGFLGLVSLGITQLRYPRRQLVSSLAIVVFLWADMQWFRSPRYWKEDSRAAVACLQAQLAPGSSVAVAPDYMRDILAHYARRSGAHLVFYGLRDGPHTPDEELPAALLVTRLHHVPDWKELTRGYRASPFHAVGYRLFVPAGRDGLDDSSTACRDPFS